MGNQEIDEAFRLLVKKIYDDHLEAIDLEQKYASGELERPILMGLKAFLDSQEVIDQTKE